MLRTRKEAGRTWEVLVGWQWWPLKTSCSWWPEFEDQARVAAAGDGIHFWCVGGLCVTHLSRSRLVSCTWGWDDFRRGHLGRMWRHPWQSASVRTTLTHLLSWTPQELCTEIRSCLALQLQLYSSYKSRTTLKELVWYFPGWLNLLCQWVVEWTHQRSRASDHERHVLSFKKIFIITFTSSVTFQLFFFFYFLTSFICCLLIRMIASQASCFVFQKKYSNHRIHKHCSLSIPFFLTSFVFADSDGWFTSIMFSF